MTEFQLQPRFDATSAAGAMMRQVGRPVVLGCMLGILGTSSASATEVLPRSTIVGQTTAGTTVDSTRSGGAALGELRRLSGLTWDQLSRIFGVSRRSLHFWASGKAMAAPNEEHLQRLLVVVRRIDRGSASANRAALFGAREDGRIPFDLLTAGEYERVVSLLGTGGIGPAPRPKLSAQARTTRAPSAPDELVGALQDRVHREGGKTRVARSVRARGGR
jgi:transcriptional regulator with XRE-family HTH domain